MLTIVKTFLIDSCYFFVSLVVLIVSSHYTTVVVIPLLWVALVLPFLLGVALFSLQEVQNM